MCIFHFISPPLHWCDTPFGNFIFTTIWNFLFFKLFIQFIILLLFIYYFNILPKARRLSNDLVFIITLCFRILLFFVTPDNLIWIISIINLFMVRIINCFRIPWWNNVHFTIIYNEFELITFSDIYFNLKVLTFFIPDTWKFFWPSNLRELAPHCHFPLFINRKFSFISF